MATYYSHWRHALLIHDGDFISTQTVSSAHQILYNDARFPLGYTESLEDETYDGNSAWFACIVGIRINKLLARFQAARLPVHTIYAEYVHFADLNAPLNDDEHAQLERLLKYGPALASHAPQGKLLLVTPRPGTISPWSSKATDIAHNCGLQQVNRLERGMAYYIEAGTLTNEQWQQVTAELHDRMMETVFLL